MNGKRVGRRLTLLSPMSFSRLYCRYAFLCFELWGWCARASNLLLLLPDSRIESIRTLPVMRRYVDQLIAFWDWTCPAKADIMRSTSETNIMEHAN